LLTRPDNILEATLPEFNEDEKETPAGFALVGHVGELGLLFSLRIFLMCLAHLNLREQYLPYKHLIGQVLLDKNPKVRTVINKTEDVGSTNPYRTFPYEVLAGPDDMDVTVSFSGCEFRFNFAKVYWNPRLNTEHERMISKFQEGEVVCDVMAGVGPFAIPAGKKKVFVSANDLNPDSNAGLKYAIKKNKVEDLVTAHCMDGREFIRSATKELSSRNTTVVIPTKTKTPRLSRSKSPPRKAPSRTLRAPKSFQHYVMNLPASAVEFLDAFKGTYAGRSQEFAPDLETKLPMIHVYCFSEQKETDQDDCEAVCELVSRYLGCRIFPSTPDTEIHFVRKVSPKKGMFCASFRLPPEIAFAA
jgi:tRNA (guanine37-N1)-methyltransferase